MVHIWSGKRDLNPRPSAWKADALPTELFPLRAKTISRSSRSHGSWWGGEDSNLRSTSATDLQSVPFDRSGTSPEAPNQQKNRPRKQKNPSWAFFALFFSQLREEKRIPGLIEHSGAGEGNRTPNLLITNQLLFRLSYASPGSLPHFFQKSNITVGANQCQGKNIS
jgi:hypothetical protein